jgi:hypothetical protein
VPNEEYFVILSLSSLVLGVVILSVRELFVQVWISHNGYWRMIDLGITEMASYFVQTERSFGDEKKK